MLIMKVLSIPLKILWWYLSWFTSLYFVLVFIPYVIVCYFAVKHVMKKTLKYREIPEEKKEIHRKYGAMRRLDGDMWNETTLFIGAVLYSWIKITLAILVVSISNLSLRILLGKKSPEDEVDHNLRRKIKIIGIMTGRVLVFVLGIVWIHEQDIEFDYSEYLGENYDKKAKPISHISNHISWLDILLYMGKISPGFISKQPVRNYIGIGYIARCLGCIFVRRVEKGDRNLAVTQVIEKQNAIRDEKVNSSLLIFVEGTTSNGSSLLPFKKGAFLNDYPIKPYLLILNKNTISLAMDVIEMLYHLFIIVCNPYFTITLLKMPVFAPNEYLFTKSKFAQGQTEKWMIFAEAVRDAMSKAGNLEKSSLTYDDKMNYLEIL